MTDEVPDLLVEKLVLGELSDAQAREVRERLGDTAQERIAAVERSNVEILADHPPAEIAGAVRRRLEERGRERRHVRGSWWLALPTVAAAAGLLLWIGTRGPEEVDVTVGSGAEANGETGETPEVIVLKGDAHLIVQRRRAGEPDEQLLAGDSIRAGDLLQLSYHSGGAEEGVILSIDGRGVVTLHHPEKPTGPTALSSGGAIALPTAYELDDAPDYERFFFVTGERVDVNVVAKAAVAVSKGAHPESDPLALPPGLEQSSLLLRKE